MTRAKAVVATIVAALVAVTTAIGPYGSLSGIDTLHWLLIIGAVLSSGGLTWWVANIAGVAGGIAKAVVAGLSAGVTSLIAALGKSPVITQSAWLVALSAAIVAGAAVYQVKNKGT